MKIPFTIEPTGENSAYVICKNVHRNGTMFLSLRCPIEWDTEDQKTKLIVLAKEMIARKINEDLR